MTPSTGWHAQLPSRVRARPRVYGTGRYGTEVYDRSDSTRYAWGRIAPAITALLVVFLGLASPARAQNAYCEGTDTITTLFGFCKPAPDVEGANRWGDKLNTNFDQLENALTTISAATGTATIALNALAVSTTSLSISTAALASGSATTYLRITGGTMSGAITDASGFVGPLTGNADTSTNLAGGGVGQIPYQSAAATTLFLPAIGAGGIVTGNGTSAVPSTGTFAGTASQVTVTRTNSNIVLSLPNPINVGTSGNAGTATIFDHTPTLCSAGNYPLGVDTGGNASGCTAAGVGNSVLSSTETHSATELFTSSITIGPSALSNGSGGAAGVVSSTISYNSVAKGMWSVVAYSSFTAASRVEFYNFNSSYTHRATLVYGQVTSNGDLYLRYQDDAGANYVWAGYGMEDNVAAFGSGAASTNQIKLTGTTALAATGVYGQVELACPMSGQPTCMGHSHLTYTNSTSAANNGTSDISAGGSYRKQAATVDRFHFITSAGTMTGYIILEAFVPNITTIPF